MRRSPIWLAWTAGLLLAVFVYTTGPDLFMFQIVDTLHVLIFRLGEAISDLSQLSQDAIRALAIGLYATFVVLALAVIRRGGRARAALVWVSLVFIIITGTADPIDAGPKWTAALLLAGVAAVSMTKRLTRLSEA